MSTAACRVVEIDAIFTNAIGGSGAHAVAPECDGKPHHYPLEIKRGNEKKNNYQLLIFPLRSPFIGHFPLPLLIAKEYQLATAQSFSIFQGRQKDPRSIPLLFGDVYPFETY